MAYPKTEGIRMRASRVNFAGLSLLGLLTGMTASSYALPARAGASIDQAPKRAGASIDQSVGARAGASGCSAYANRQIGGATVDKAEWLPAGTPTSVLGQKAPTDICRISAHIKPVPGSEIKFHVWLPANWNGKMFSFGGGGFNGSLSIDGVLLTKPVSEGYAALSTDAGHDASDGAKWALGNPEKIVDFGYRANHLGAVAAKAFVADYYGTPAKRAYFHGCSNGGRDALMLAQRYPDDYDAIVSGAPANSWTALMSSFARSGLVARPTPGVDVLAPKLKLVREAALKKCDAADGVKDGLVGNPSICRFDPAVLTCKAGAGSNCLSKAEVAAVRGIYQGASTRDGRTIMPGFPAASESEWPTWFTSPKGQAPAMAQDFFRYMVYDRPDWDLARFDLDRDYPAAKRKLASVLDATHTDLRSFIRKGGKLLMYHGWDDPAIPAGNSIRYFEGVRKVLGARTDGLRLFMVPGMAHCGGGAGPDNVGWLAELDKWSTSGTAPERLTATKFADAQLALIGMATKPIATRPVCAWPKTPYYRGSGPIDKETSFVCR